MNSVHEPTAGNVETPFPERLALGLRTRGLLGGEEARSQPD